MNITIRDTNADPRDVILVREASAFILSRLLKPSQLKHVNLHVNLAILKDDLGDIGIEEAPTFRLRLHRELDSLAMIVTLAHELVHLAQVMNGKLFLKEINGLEVWHWLNVPYGHDPYGDKTLILPWEVEAEQREVDLACHFFSHYVTKLNGS